MGAVLFLLSRLWFLNFGEVFFDSAEYLRRWANSSFIDALITGHPPLHMGYVLFNWPIFQWLSSQDKSPLPFIGMIQVILALLTVFFFGKVVEELVDGKTAGRAMILISLIPIFWIVNVTVSMETIYLFFFFGSLFFLSRYTKGTGNYFDLIFSCLFWSMAFLTHTVVMIWIPLVIYLAWMWNRKKIGMVIISGAVTLVIASVINAIFLSYSLGTGWSGGLYWLYAAKFGEHARFSLDLATIFRYLRNWIIPLIYNNTSAVVVLASLSWLRLWIRNKKMFWLVFLWLMPSFIANQWWDSLLYGRHALIASFGLAFLVARILNRARFWMIAGLILVISLSSMIWIIKPIPYNLMAKKIGNLPPGGLLIDSHFARPYTSESYFGKTIYVDEPGWSIESTAEEIEKYIDNRRDVYVTGHALSEPYGLFSGPYLHPLSLSYRNEYILKPLTNKWGFAYFSEVDRDLNLMIFKVFPQSFKYASIKKLDENRRRIDYLDPLRIFVWVIRGGLNL